MSSEISFGPDSGTVVYEFSLFLACLVRLLCLSDYSLGDKVYSLEFVIIDDIPDTLFSLTFSLSAFNFNCSSCSYFFFKSVSFDAIS